MDLCRTAVKER